MTLSDRVAFAFVGSIFGAFIGALCWWLYGLGHSMQYYGPPIDPNIFHWLGYTSGAFAILGFIFPNKAAELSSDTIGVILHFEAGTQPRFNPSAWVVLVFLVLAAMAVWFTLGAE